MTDVELARAVERGDVAGGAFNHADHLRVALVYLADAPTVDAAIDRMATTLRQVASAAGKPERYSQSMTEFWMYQLAAARALKPGADADALFTAYPSLLNKNLPLALSAGDAGSSVADSPR